MAKTLLLVWSSPASADVEDEFNRWYDESHVPELRAAIPSITVAHRYRLRAEPGQVGTRYLTTYEFDEDDVEAAVAAFNGALGSGRVGSTQTIDLTNQPPVIQWYQHL